MTTSPVNTPIPILMMMLKASMKKRQDPAGIIIHTHTCTHAHTHTQQKREKVYVCSECSKGYTHKDTLMAYLKTKHDIQHSKHSKRFKCPYCDVASPFHTLNQMKSHCESEHEKKLGNN